MENSAKDHDLLIELIHQLPKPCQIGFEATGNYRRTLYYRLVSKGFQVNLISFLASSRLTLTRKT